MAIPPVVIEFLARGVPDIARATRSVADAVARGDRVVTETTTTGERTRARLVDQSAREKIRAMQAADRAVASAQRAGQREAEAAMRAEVRAAQQTANERIRIANKVAAEERKLQLQIARGGSSTATAGAQQRLGILQASRTGSVTDQRAALAQVGALQIEHTAAAAEERAAQKRIQIREREADEETRIAQSAAQKQEAAAQRAAEETYQKRKKFADALIGAGGRAISHAVRGGVALASLTAQLGGGFSVQDAMQSRVDLERQAAILSNKDPTGGRMSVAEITGKARVASRMTGMNENDLLGAWEAYADKTGDFQGGEKNMEFFGKLAKATGADIGQIATTAGLLRVQNKNLGESEMKDMLLNVVAQGRSGAVDFGELAGHASAITKTSSAFAGDQTDTQRRLLALSQIGVRTGSVSEAATMISNISADAGKHSKSLNKLLGGKAFNEKGQIAEAPEQFLADIIAKTGGNRQKIQQLGFGQRSIKLFDALLPTYNDAEADALKKGKSKKEASEIAKKAVLDDMGQFTNAKYGQEELNKDYSSVMASSAEQFEGAVRQLKQEVGEKLVPAMLPLVAVLADATPKIGQLLDAFVGLVQWAEANPMKAAVAGMGVMLGQAAVEEFAKAKLGDLIRNMLQGGSGGGLPGAGGLPGTNGIGGGGGAGGAPGGPSAGALGLLAVGVAAQVGELSDLGDERLGATRAGDTKGKQIAADLKSGDSKKVSEAISEIQAARGKTNVDRVGAAYADTASRAIGAVSSPLGYGGAKLSDYVAKKLGYKSTAETSVETLTAAQLLKSSGAEGSDDAPKASGTAGDVKLGAFGASVQKQADSMEKLTTAIEKNTAAQKAPTPNGSGGGGGQVNGGNPSYSKPIIKRTTGN